eukprot:g12662.t1
MSCQDGHGKFRANLAADGQTFTGTAQLDATFSLEFKAHRGEIPEASQEFIVVVCEEESVKCPKSLIQALSAQLDLHVLASVSVAEAISVQQRQTPCCRRHKGAPCFQSYVVRLVRRLSTLFADLNSSGDRACAFVAVEADKPPAGFGKFYEKAQAKPGAKPDVKPKTAETSAFWHARSAQEAAEQNSKDSKGPKETPAEEAKAEGKEGKGAVAMSAFFSSRSDPDAPQEVTMQEMLKEIVNQFQARVFLRKESNATQQMVTINLGRAEAFEQKLENVQNELGIPPMEHIPVQYVNETDWLSELLPYIPSLLFLIPLLMVPADLEGGMSSASARLSPLAKRTAGDGLWYVAGLEQPKAEVMEFVDFLKTPEKYAKLGARVPKGGLFVGPPGTGKTLLAKAVAGEADCPFYSMSGSDFVEMYVGVGASRVRDLFKQARDSAPSIIFIDEIDAIGRKRGKGGFTDLKMEDVAKRMAALTPGFAGADIANVCNEAAIFAARRAATAVSMEDFERACERVIGGLPKNNSLMSADDKHTVAIHESGHAVAGWFLEHADPLLKVSIQPRSSGALGFAQYLPAEMSLYSKEAILDKIASQLKAAEELFVGKISTGASDDLDKVTKMAHAMVANYGMSDKIGLLNFGQNDASNQFYKPYSETTGQLIDQETREVVDQQYERVKKLLLEHEATKRSGPSMRCDPCR